MTPTGNKAKGWISKRTKQEKKDAKFSKKGHFLPPDTHIYVCVLGGKNCLFLIKFDMLCFLGSSDFPAHKTMKFYQWLSNPYESDQVNMWWNFSESEQMVCAI